VLALAKSQHGHVARRQLLALGLSRGTIDGRIEAGEYLRVHHGVYGIAPLRDDPVSRAAAAVLACGEGAVLSHGSAATLWGFSRYWTFPLEVIAKGERERPGITTHRCRTLKRRDVTRQLGIPTTSPERTILDLAPRLAKKQLTRMVNDARLRGYVHLASLTDLVARNRHHPGAKLLKPFVEQPGNPTRSGFEDAFRDFCAKYGLPTPLINTMLNGYEVDAYFPDHRLIVQLDGLRYHNDPASFEEDRDRDAEQLKHGVRTIRITDERFITSPDREAARLLEILDGQ
jgi:Transcriptional regulator, AbiEi antitoxin